MKSRMPPALVAMPLVFYPLLSSSTALAQSAPLVDVCSGIQANLPVLQPVASGLGVILQPLADLINLDIVGALSGKPIGISVLDTNGNLISVPGNCGVSTDTVAIDANAGITMGGGVLTGLGGAGNLQASAGEAHSIALGNGATTTAGAANALAFGLRGSVSALDGIALGRDAMVTADGAVALGAGSVAARAGMNGATEAYSGVAVTSTNGAVSVGTAGGERQITHVAGGTLDTDAVNLRQLRGVNDGLTNQINTVSGTLTTQINTVAADVRGLERNVDILNQNVTTISNTVDRHGAEISELRQTTAEIRKEARQGIAAAMAMASAPTPSAPGKTAWSTNVAAFKGQVATSFALAHTFDTAYPVTVNASVGYAPGGSAGVRMGLSGEF